MIITGIPKGAIFDFEALTNYSKLFGILSINFVTVNKQENTLTRNYLHS